MCFHNIIINFCCIFGWKFRLKQFHIILWLKRKINNEWGKNYQLIWRKTQNIIKYLSYNYSLYFTEKIKERFYHNLKAASEPFLNSNASYLISRGVLTINPQWRFNEPRQKTPNESKLVFIQHLIFCDSPLEKIVRSRWKSPFAW